jgi:hypothetical protein
VTLGISSPSAEEVVLALDLAFPNAAPPGTGVEFVGTPTAFTRSPFLLTVAVQRDQIEGWPEPPPPVPGKEQQPRQQ